MTPKSNYICISGIMGSGKTTLARNLARQMGWLYLPESRNAVNFLEDLFANPRRWAFDVQVSFLSEKAIQLTDALRAGYKVIVDRSLSEDIYIFAEYFHQSGFFDRRSYSTYLEIAEYFIGELRAPDLVVYCDTARDLAKQRIKQRSEYRGYAYPDGHFDNIADRYDTWIQAYDESPIFNIDGALWDYRQKETVAEIGVELTAILEREWAEVEQLSLFDISSDKLHQQSLVILNDRNGTRKKKGSQPSKVPRNIGREDTPPYPYVYLAAPFTGKAEETTPNATPQIGLFGSEAPHGKLSPGRYRRNLIRISRVFESLGLYTLLPHRDVNEWGNKLLNSFEVMSACTMYVSNCDLFFGLLGQSTGVHYEYGIARAKGKPCIIIHCTELNDSFIAVGVDRDENTLVLSCEKLEGVTKLLSGQAVREFVRRHVTL
jgi:deoxyadenosine/deoxycytidine kinase